MYKINDLVSIDAGTSVWSIDLQMMVIFEKETIYKITGLCASRGEPIFGKRCELLFNCIGMIPGIIETKNEFTINEKIIKPYSIPKPQFFEYTVK